MPMLYVTLLHKTVRVFLSVLREGGYENNWLYGKDVVAKSFRLPNWSVLLAPSVKKKSQILTSGWYIMLVRWKLWSLYTVIHGMLLAKKLEGAC